MAVNKYTIKHWYLMITGNSVDHVEQALGKNFRTDQVYGYFNDLTNKVLRQPQFLGNNNLPEIKTNKGDIFQFPVAIFQYGLGAYDCFLNTGEEKYLVKFKQCSEWAISHMESNGAWDNFSFIYSEHPYGAMCQGEGVSLLLRAYLTFNDKKYLQYAKSALDFMLLPIEKSGTTSYKGGRPVFLEYTHKATVLNGWIFAFFGLWDYVKVSKDIKYQNILEDAISELENQIDSFDAKFWSYYNNAGLFTSPFYHKLHISQMEALYLSTGRKKFSFYKNKWEREQTNYAFKLLAFVIKALQKIFEKSNY